MNDFVASPFFGVVLCIGTYAVGWWINQKTKSPVANPLLISMALVIVVLTVFHIPLEDFNRGGDFIGFFLIPATAALALSIYRQLWLLKRNFLPIIIGAAVGSLASMGSVYGLCRLFGVDQVMVSSLIPKSVTTPIAMDVSIRLGGEPSITVAAVIITGIIGAILAPVMIKLFRVKNPIAAGVAIGTSSHALGTAKAIEIGEVEGAMSGLAIGISGILTVLFALIIS
ncbi:MAG: LrgB family protein [Christensenella hongkongensis]|uniref:LrgB family protein n=1 Tax=Christensenella hongkongensis TaxID=270498 RepID=UPI002A760FCC|nr:LrgB family protein [Christensenella hongkongensis]MDY3003703.1 LrgB family protein [Christensenella hongkongensis]